MRELGARVHARIEGWNRRGAALLQSVAMWHKVVAVVAMHLHRLQLLLLLRMAADASAAAPAAAVDILSVYLHGGRTLLIYSFSPSSPIIGNVLTLHPGRCRRFTHSARVICAYFLFVLLLHPAGSGARARAPARAFACFRARHFCIRCALFCFFLTPNRVLCSAPHRISYLNPARAALICAQKVQHLRLKRLYFDTINRALVRSAAAGISIAQLHPHSRFNKFTPFHSAVGEQLIEETSFSGVILPSPEWNTLDHIGKNARITYR